MRTPERDQLEDCRGHQRPSGETTRQSCRKLGSHQGGGGKSTVNQVTVVTVVAVVTEVTVVTVVTVLTVVTVVIVVTEVTKQLFTHFFFYNFINLLFFSAHKIISPKNFFHQKTFFPLKNSLPIFF